MPSVYLLDTNIVSSVMADHPKSKPGWRNNQAR
jgi:hypothetical protein